MYTCKYMQMCIHVNLYCRVERNRLSRMRLRLRDRPARAIHAYIFTDVQRVGTLINELNVHIMTEIIMQSAYNISISICTKYIYIYIYVSAMIYIHICIYIHTIRAYNGNKCSLQ